MSVARRMRTAVVDAVHSVVCGTNPARPDDGCCGCGAAVADVYITYGCRYCGAPGEPYCWICIDTWPAGAAPISPADLTIFPGHERGPQQRS